MKNQLSCHLIFFCQLVFLSCVKDNIISMQPEEFVDKEKTLQLLRQYFDSEDNPDAILAEIKKAKGISCKIIESLLSEVCIYKEDVPKGIRKNLAFQLEEKKFRYSVYIPEDYNSKKSYPLVVHLHGAGSSGSDYLERWAKFLKNNYILLCPTSSQVVWVTDNNLDYVVSLIKETKNKYNIDENRIYLTGISMGGHGTYYMSMLKPDMFAAISPMAGAFRREMDSFLPHYKNLPVYIIHGAKDNVIPTRFSREAYKKLTDLKLDVIYKEHPGGHLFPTKEFPDLLNFFSQKSRIVYPREVVLINLATFNLPKRIYWARIDETEKDVNPAKITAKTIEGNKIEVSTENIKKYTLFLHNNLIDLSNPVIITTNGKTSFEGIVKEDIETLFKDAKKRRDFSMVFTAQVTIEVK